MALSATERKRRQLSTPEGREKHRAANRRYYHSGGRHQQSATRAQHRIERYQRDLEALTA